MNNLEEKYDIIVVTIGAITNGIPNIGFNTIGNPNITGSLMLKIDGANPKASISLLLLPAIAIAINNPIITPDPPMNTKASKNGPANTCN